MTASGSKCDRVNSLQATKLVDIMIAVSAEQALGKVTRDRCKEEFPHEGQYTVVF